MWGFALFAQAGGGGDNPMRRPEVIWGTIGLAVALLVGAAVIWLVDKWRKRHATGTIDPHRELTDFRTLYEQGEITEEEYNRLRNRVAERVKAAVGLPPPPPPSDPANPPPPA